MVKSSKKSSKKRPSAIRCGPAQVRQFLSENLRIKRIKVGLISAEADPEKKTARLEKELGLVLEEV